MKKYILLADCSELEVASFANNFFYQNQPLEVKSHIANWKRTGKISELIRYGKYFGVAFLYFLKRNKYTVIVGWQQFYALIFCFFCSVFSVRKTTTVIVLNFTYKKKSGIFEKPYRWFMGKCTSPKYMDYLHVLSQEYAEYIHSEFNFPIERIIVSHFGVNDRLAELGALPSPPDFQEGQYALSIGRSNRDYDFLIKAWKGIDFPLVIISDTYKGNIDSDNITLLSNIAGEEANPWIANCGLMIIPIDDGSICSGDTVLLTAMSLERKIIVTTPSTLAEMYIENGIDSIAIPKNVDIFKSTVQEVLFCEKYKDLGVLARKHFLARFSRESMAFEISKFLKTCDN